MATTSTKELLKDKRVIEEIERHKWFESQKAGCDIGFEKASKDWITRFSKEWLKENMEAPKKAVKRIKKTS
ncbi:MAG: hypothetical protein HQL21_00145 [Candidatus Omnitrophica bacterium]|nr:hypothetical protein [Candidatus Omnitrophota bacterium]